VDWAISEKSYTQRKACHLVGLEPNTYRYQSRRSDNTGLHKCLRELAREQRQFGYRRLHLLLERKVSVTWWTALAWRAYDVPRWCCRKTTQRGSHPP
jgi:putative transposase